MVGRKKAGAEPLYITAQLRRYLEKETRTSQATPGQVKGGMNRWKNRGNDPLLVDIVARIDALHKLNRTARQINGVLCREFCGPKAIAERTAGQFNPGYRKFSREMIRKIVRKVLAFHQRVKLQDS